MSHDGPGKVIFFEGARITLEAHIAEYPPDCHAELRKVAAIGDAWHPDRILVLTSSTDTIEKHILRRNRPHEDVDGMVRRFRLIDAEFRRLAPSFPNAIVINRDGLEFHERDGLEHIIRAGRITRISGNSLSRHASVRPDCQIAWTDAEACRLPGAALHSRRFA
jgi:hypothetical protein